MTGCHCTPVCLQAEINTNLKKVHFPEPAASDLAAIAVTAIQMPRLPQVDLLPVGMPRRVPDDLIVLCERWLI